MATLTNRTLEEVADLLRVDSIRATSAAGSGHLTSSCSIAEIMAVLFLDVIRFDPAHPDNPDNDRFVLSKGHASPVYYAAMARAGWLEGYDITNLRKVDSVLEGHPTPRLRYVDAATGSLGQGLSIGCGMAYAGKYLEKRPYRVFVLLGDGETAEGAVWEAASFASHYNLDNLVAIVDVNRLGQSEETQLGQDVDAYVRRFSAFGWNAVEVDGHDIEALSRAFDRVENNAEKPLAIVARTIKGKGIPEIADQNGYHGKPIDDDLKEKAIERLNKESSTKLSLGSPLPPSHHSQESDLVTGLSGRQMIHEVSPDYQTDEQVATRDAFGTALSHLARQDELIVILDGDVKNSTRTETYLKDGGDPSRFIQCFISEQNMVGVAVGLASRGLRPVVGTFAAFLTRAFDQIRMAAISGVPIVFCGSHAGVSIGQDGPSQMGLEDLAMFRTIPGSQVFYPTDAVSAERAVALALAHDGISYIRTGRPESPVLYPSSQSFEVGRANLVRVPEAADLTIVAAGVTLFEALKAADILEGEGVHARVIDPFTIKPIDAETIRTCAYETGGLLVVVEDHYSQGGLGGALSEALSEDPGLRIHQLAVLGVPRSGEPEELLQLSGIDAERIAQVARDALA